MKKVSATFTAIFLSLGLAVNAKNSESFTAVNSDKTTLQYYNSTELIVWENVATQGGEISESLSAAYNMNEHQLVIKGTKANGDIEVWDVYGNTVVEKGSADKQTILKIKALPKGTYYISYSNGDHAEGTKLVIK